MPREKFLLPRHIKIGPKNKLSEIDDDLNNANGRLKSARHLMVENRGYVLKVRNEYEKSDNNTMHLSQLETTIIENKKIWVAIDDIKNTMRDITLQISDNKEVAKAESESRFVNIQSHLEQHNEQSLGVIQDVNGNIRLLAQQVDEIQTKLKLMELELAEIKAQSYKNKCSFSEEILNCKDTTTSLMELQKDKLSADFSNAMEEMKTSVDTQITTMETELSERINAKCNIS